MNLWELEALPVEELVTRLTGFVPQDMLSGVFRRDDAIGEFVRNYVRRGGIVDVRGVMEVVADGFGFIRSEKAGYATLPDDVYVSPNYIRRFNIRTGDIVDGPVRDAGRERPDRGKERSFALARVDSVNGHLATEWQSLVQFDDLTPVHPTRRIQLERIAPGPEPTDLTMRFVDLFAPVGFGQRGLVIAPPRAGKTTIIQKIASAISSNYPDALLLVLLIGESREEITDMERVLGAKVLSAAFDDPPERQVQVAEMTVEMAKRKVEAGKDVVILMDSITRFARACNAIAPQSGRTTHEGIDLGAMSRPRKLFGSARATEGGGSLTIIATALSETGSRMDDVVLEELRGAANMTLVLDGQLASRRIFPAIDVQSSGTRKEEFIVTPPELNLARSLRKMLADSPTPIESMENIIRHMRKSASNAEFIMQKFNQ
ncbi:MAG: transcription termination factor Rho [Kiritimatiellae bacterium]|nr:transcription termination factor Rho [Kiritimatiellia bacterium]